MFKKFIIGLLALVVMAPSAHAGEVFDRVMETRTLRCAYTIYPPFFIKDPNTDVFTGLMHDVLEEIGKELSIKIEWSEEVGSDAILQGLQSGRYDAVCPGYFATPARANGSDFSKPVFYVPTYIYVRADEDRFQTIEDLNAETVKMGTMDGEFSDILQRQRFTKAQPVSLIGLSSAAERFELIATGKADFTVAEAAIGAEYIAKNPGKLKKFGDPVFNATSNILLPLDEYPLVAYLNSAIDGLLLSGKLESIIRQYNQQDSFLVPAKPYEVK